MTLTIEETTQSQERLSAFRETRASMRRMSRRLSRPNRWQLLEVSESCKSFVDVEIPTRREVISKRKACLKKFELNTKKNHLLYPLIDIPGLTDRIGNQNQTSVTKKAQTLSNLRYGVDGIITQDYEEEYQADEILVPEHSDDYKKYCHLWVTGKLGEGSRKPKYSGQKVIKDNKVPEKVTSETSTSSSFNETQAKKLLQYKKFLDRFSLETAELYRLNKEYLEHREHRKLDTVIKRKADKCINELASSFMKFISLLGGTDASVTLDEETIKNNLTASFSKHYQPISIIVDEIKTLTRATVSSLSKHRSIRNLSDVEFSPKLQPDPLPQTRLAQAYYVARHIPVSKWDERYRKIIKPPEQLAISKRKYYTGKTGEISENEIAKMATTYATDKYIQYLNQEGGKKPLFIKQIVEYKNILDVETNRKDKFLLNQKMTFNVNQE